MGKSSTTTTLLHQPAPQVALPHTPPLTPPQNKDHFPSLVSQYAPRTPVLSPSSSPESESSAILSPAADLPGLGAGIGLGLGFGDRHNMSATSTMSTSTSTTVNEKIGARLPILPPNHPLRNNLQSHGGGGAGGGDYSRRPLSMGISGNHKTNKSSGILNPYSSSTPGSNLLSKAGLMIRVPRRLRPALLLATSLFVIAIIVISRSVSDAPLVRSGAQDNLSAFGRRAYRENTAAGAFKQAIVRVPSSRITAASQVGGLEFESKHDELLALISFMTSATGNSLPAHVDGSKPVPAHVLLGFDTTAEYAKDDLEIVKDEVNDLNPIVVFGRLRDPFHRELRRILNSYKIVPAPLFVDVDQRRDAANFVPTLERLLGSSDFPQLVVKGKTLASFQKLVGLHDDDELAAALEKAGGSGVSVRRGKTNKKGRKELERQELERVLRPNPVEDK
ncbi:hypothetical protein Q8F55_006292 [Vanrija albida]|uniref:Glutaredoxin domain-containing protein n=1 Tax=Vanrija albida TaxID=181172 RepID=A0ABR3PWP1_9TREE